jgi:hypothetical protein
MNAQPADPFEAGWWKSKSRRRLHACIGAQGAFGI